MNVYFNAHPPNSIFKKYIGYSTKKSIYDIISSIFIVREEVNSKRSFLLKGELDSVMLRMKRCEYKIK